MQNAPHSSSLFTRKHRDQCTVVLLLHVESASYALSMYLYSVSLTLVTHIQIVANHSLYKYA